MPINLKKLDRMEELAFRNGLRLHRDSILLFKSNRYPTAFHLSVLAQEEFGKAQMISQFLFNSRVDGRAEPEQEEEWLQMLYSHPVKQNAFLRHSPLMDFSPSFLKLMREISDGKLEQEKQAATYVGLKRGRKRSIEISGRLQNPERLTRKKSENQITKINDSLIDLSMGVIHDYYIVENDEVRKLLNRKLLKELEAKWRVQGKQAAARIRSVKQQLAKT